MGACCASAGATPADERPAKPRSVRRTRGKRGTFTCSYRISALPDDAKEDEQEERAAGEHREGRPGHLVVREAPPAGEGVGRHLRDGAFELACLDIVGRRALGAAEIDDPGRVALEGISLWDDRALEAPSRWDD